MTGHTSRHKFLVKSDPVVAIGTIKRFIPATILDSWSYKASDRVEIAKIIDTACGRRYRIKGTLHWLSEADIKIEKAFINNFTNKDKSLQKISVNKFTSKNKSDTNKMKNTTAQKRIIGRCGMDKTVLKTVILGLTKGDELTVTLRESWASKSGRYRVVGFRTGRGKGGSRLLDLVSVSTGEQLTIGTPRNDDVLNVVTSDGVLHGYESESLAPKFFETDAGNAATLKERLQAVLEAGVGCTVRVRSSVSDFDGTFTVQEVVQLRGRHGQVLLRLQAGDGTVRELWSYRHSGVVTNVEVVE